MALSRVNERLRGKCSHPRTAENTVTYGNGHPQCRPCRLTAQARYQKTSRGRDVIYRVRYGISLDDYEAMMWTQAGLCGSCIKPRARLFVDHDHVTGAVRGLLCSECNTSLGLLREDLATLDSLKAYLVAHE